MRNRIGIFLALFAMLSTQASCAASRDEVLSRSLAGVEAAEKSFLSYDRAHQGGIVDSATSREQGERSLAEYRAQRDTVVAALIVAYNAIAIASATTTDETIKSTIDAITDLLSSLRRLGVIPGAKP